MIKKTEEQKSSNRSFGIVFFLVFLIVSILPLFNDENIRIWAIIIAIIFLYLGLKNSPIEVSAKHCQKEIEKKKKKKKQRLRSPDEMA